MFCLSVVEQCVLIQDFCSVGADSLPVTWSHVVSVRVSVFVSLVLVLLALSGLQVSTAYAATPHAGYSTSTERCGACHIPHQAARGTKIMRSAETVLCLTCHDGRGSSLNVATDFTSATDTRFAHDVTESARTSSGGRTACASCHDPHDAVAGARYIDPDAPGAPMSVPVASVVASTGSVYVLVGSEHDAVPPLASATSIEATPAVPTAPAVTWVTNEYATSWIDWGTTTAYELGNAVSGSPFGNGALVTTHRVSMSGLALGSTYHYRIRTADALGNVTLGADRTYKPTTPPPIPVVSDVTTFTGGGWGPVLVPITSSSVTSSDGHPVQYQFLVIGVGDSGWISSASWSASLFDGTYSVRVRARDAVDTASVSEWSVADAFVVQGAAYPEEGSVLAAPVKQRVLESLGVGAPPTAALETTPNPIPGEYSIDTDLLVLRTRDSAGAVTTFTVSGAWETSSAFVSKPNPSTPGSSVAPGIYSNAGTENSVYWRTSLASTDRAWDWQLVRFDLGSSAQTSIRELTVLWRGHGVPTPGYDTALYVWDVTAGSWSETSRDEVPADRAVGWTSQSVSGEFCLRCHDGDAPDGVVVPSEVTTISTNWGVGGDRHGAGVGTGFGGTLVSPYARGQDAVACVTCHDTHGSGSIYHFPSKVNDNAPGPITTGASGALCASCHSGGLSDWHQPCYACHAEPHELAPDITDRLPTLSSDCLSCHGHGRSWTHVDGCLACHGSTELELLGAGGHAPWTYPKTF